MKQVRPQLSVLESPGSTLREKAQFSKEASTVRSQELSDQNSTNALQETMDLLARDTEYRVDFNPAATTLAQPSAGITIPDPMDAICQDDMVLDDPELQFEFQPFDAFLFERNVPHLAFWEDPQFMAPLYQDPAIAFEQPLPGVPTAAIHAEQLPSHVETDDSLPDSGNAPVPCFLDARSGPEPQHGQQVRFREFMEETWPDQGRQRHWTAYSRLSGNRTEESRYPPPLMGTFSPVVSSEESNNIWESENLAHVPSLPQQTYDSILSKFQELNTTNSHYNQFVAGDFPSLSACNAFLQLFFEEFNPLFPLIHQPTFDPTTEPWLLILAMVAIGCHYSQHTAAVECADILQEFVHRAFEATVRGH
jgi:hypothetical protein